jgi:flagellar biosynthesis/type III secretory pathway protein FliH
VDVSNDASRPAWMSGVGPAIDVDDSSVSPLTPPEVPSHPRPDLAPVLESVRPPKPDPEADDATAAGRKRPDTLIEELIPRADEEAAASIASALSSFAAERQRTLDAAEGQLVELVKLIGRRVLLRELHLDPRLVQNLVQEGLSALGQSDRVTVKLGAFFADARPDIEARLEEGGMTCRVVVDPALGRYACQLETQLGRVDESVEARLDALLSGLED